MSNSSEFNWNQPENFDDEFGVEQSEIVPSYENPPSEEVVKHGADYLVLRDELEAQIKSPRKLTATLGCLMAMFILLFLITSTEPLGFILAILIGLGPFFVLALTDWHRVGRHPVVDPKRIFVNSNRLAAFGRAYTPLSPLEAKEAVLAEAKAKGIELRQTGPTTWEGERPADYTMDRSVHKLDIRPSVDRPGMTLITSSTTTKQQSFTLVNTANWKLNYALLHATEDAQQVDPRKPSNAELPRDAFKSWSGQSDD